MKRIIVLFLVLLLPFASAIPVNEWERHVYYRSITLYAPAVAQAENGSYFGVLTEINVTMMNGSGNIFVITTPLTQLDMQGSAKLAVDVAGMLTGKDISKYDFFFKIEADTPIVGGPSAGATMCIAVICLLENIEARDGVIMTGMINPDGSIGPVGGILAKGEAAGKAGMKYFLIPKGQNIDYKIVEKRIGWVTYRYPIPINVSKELYEKYGLIVKEVEDINEALAYFTGYCFEEEKSNISILTANYYREIIKPINQKIIKEANNSYIKAKNSFEKSKIPIGTWFYSPRGVVSNRLDDAENALKDAELAYENAFYYYSISKAFQSMINSRFVIYACKYYNGTSINEIYNITKEKAEKALEEAENSKINGLVSLQCIGGAQQRALEAMEYLNKSGEKLDYLYYLAYAIERSKTVYWWINLSKKFNESYKIGEEWIEAIADKYYDYAQSIISYADILSKETGYSKEFVNMANNLLKKAFEQKKKYPASSLFNSLEAIANANLAIELVGISKIEEVKDKLDRTSQLASYAIQKARNISIEPILAVSYYEFGKSIENEDAKDALVYYKYASMIANMLCLAKGFKSKNLKKAFLEENEIKKINFLDEFFVVIAFISGIIIGFIISRIKKGRREEKIVTPDEAAENLKYFFDNL